MVPPQVLAKKVSAFLVPSGFGRILLPKPAERKIPSKNERNPGMKEFSSISNEILKGIHIKENLSRNEKSRNDGILFNF